MSTSTSNTAYVWIWLPGAASPVPAGALTRRHGGLLFHYGNLYLERPDIVSIYGPTLPLVDKWFGPTGDLDMPGALRDGSPDAWGRRVILNRLTGDRGRDADTTAVDEMTYLLRSGTNRLGAIDFQSSPTHYVPRDEPASLDDLYRAAQIVESGELLPVGLGEALQGASTIGGARPKAILDDGEFQWIAKFSTSSDTFSVVGAEAASIELARAAGINVPESRVVTSLGRDVLLTKRFDRPGGGQRKMVVSGLTMLGLDETEARYGSYLQLVQVLRKHGSAPATVGRDIFSRIAFNIAISNTDDHLRNHAALWDGKHLALTPAYDLSPMSRSGETASQAITYGKGLERESNVASLLAVRSQYGLSLPAARSIIDNIIDAIQSGWDDAADVARLSTADKAFLWQRQFLNPGSLYGY